MARIATRFAATIAIGLSAWMAVSPSQGALADPGDGSIHGIVTAPDGSVPDAPVTVTLGTVASTTTAADGSYSFTGLAAAGYDLSFDYAGPSKIVRHERWDGTFGTSGAGVVLGAGATREIDLRLAAGATVSGSVTGVDGPLDSTTTVTLLSRLPASNYRLSAAFDPAHQTWQAVDVPPGRYSVLVDPPERWDETQWGVLTVAEGVDLADAPHQLARSTSIAGDVDYLVNGVATPLPDGTAWVWNHGGYEISAPIVDGRYEFDRLLGGQSYTVCFQEAAYVDLTCYGGGGFYDPPNVTLADGQVLDGIDATVERGGQIVVHLAGSGQPQWQLRLLRLDPETGSYGQEQDDYPPGNLNDTGISFVAPGTYHLQVIDMTDTNAAQYWKGARDADEATDIVVTAGQTVDLGTISLDPWNVDMNRIGGADRFEVSAGVSRARFTSVPDAGVPVVYVANGLNYPDALSAGPAAIKEKGDLLLVTPNEIPAPIATELSRLRPQRIVVVGGPASVSNEVLHRLDGYVTGASGKAERLSGADRFEASRNLAQYAFGSSGAATVFIATGNNYPDALSAGPAAGSVGAPVVLVNGFESHLDAATAQLLRNLHTTSIDLVGGPASVSFGIQEDLEALVGPDHLTTYGGQTRFDNAAQLGADFFRHTDAVFFADGLNFPDALSAAAFAAYKEGPIDLVQPDCVPGSVEYWLRAQAAQHIWLIGGPASLGSGVEKLTSCPN